MIESAIDQYLKRHHFQKISPKAVFFDMDGVLFDSMPFHSVAWVRAMNESGLPFTRTEAYMCEGQTGADTINMVFRREYGRESTEAERQAIYKLKSKYFDELGKVERMTYSYELLLKLKAKGYKLFVVTGSAHPSLLDGLKIAFPGIFEKENVISAFDVQNGKPHPEPYLKALKRANLKPWEALVVENAPLGVTSSSTAQIFTFGVNTGPLDRKILAENGADLVLDSLQELFEKWDTFKF